MDWYVVDKNYINYLLTFDSKVGFVEYGEKLKLHIGIILTVDEVNYYVPVSSAKSKHLRMSNSLDFHKIEFEQQLLAVINLNNMIPVLDKCVTQIKYNNVSNFRSFETEQEKTNYIYLLQKEKKVIDSITTILSEKAVKLHKNVLEKPSSKLAQRCYNFKLMEEKLKLYK